MARLILGLGNPGPQYRGTRHNAGFLVVDELARRWGFRLDRDQCRSLVAAGPVDGVDGEILLAQPQTFMNRSGWAARCLVETHGLDPSSGLLVVYDEVVLPLGRLRLRRSGSPAGHRGIESVIENLCTDQVPRLRLGVSPEDGPPPGEDLVDFVLSPFPEDQQEAVEAMVKRAADACETWLREGPEIAMSRFNG